jgi:hypothetical protein
VRDFLRIGNDFYAIQTARVEELSRHAKPGNAS